MEKPSRFILWGLFTLLVPGFLAALLVGPRAPDDKQSYFCVMNIRTASVFGISLNCDSALHIAYARDPMRILQPGNLRQSRPMMVLPPFLLRPLFAAFDDLPARFGARPVDMMPDNFQRTMPDLIERGFSGFLAYAAFNLLLLALCYALYLHLVGGAASAAGALLVGSIGLLLVGNDVVKAFFWSPHTQLYNILVPLIAVWSMTAPASGWRRGALIGLASGAGVLAYPLFLIVPACYALRAACDAVLTRRAAPLAAAAGALAAVFLAPVAWYLFVRWIVGSFYSDTLAYDQGIWIVDSLRRGTFWIDLAAPAGDLLFYLKLQLVALGVMAVLALTLFVLALARIDVRRTDAALCVAAFAVSAITFAFYALAGINYARCAAAAIPPLVVACGVLARVSAEAARPWAVWAAALGALATIEVQLIHTAVKAGPYS